MNWHDIVGLIFSSGRIMWHHNHQHNYCHIFYRVLFHMHCYSHLMPCTCTASPSCCMHSQSTVYDWVINSGRKENWVKLVNKSNDPLTQNWQKVSQYLSMSNIPKGKKTYHTHKKTSVRKKCEWGEKTSTSTSLTELPEVVLPPA